MTLVVDASVVVKWLLNDSERIAKGFLECHAKFWAPEHLITHRKCYHPGPDFPAQFMQAAPRRGISSRCIFHTHKKRPTPRFLRIIASCALQAFCHSLDMYKRHNKPFGLSHFMRPGPSRFV